MYFSRGAGRPVNVHTLRARTEVDNASDLQPAHLAQLGRLPISLNLDCGRHHVGRTTDHNQPHEMERVRIRTRSSFPSPRFLADKLPDQLDPFSIEVLPCARLLGRIKQISDLHLNIALLVWGKEIVLIRDYGIADHLCVALRRSVRRQCDAVAHSF